MFNFNNDNANQDVEIVANMPSYDEGLQDEDITELPFGDDIDAEHSSSNGGVLNNRRNKMILVVTAAILLLCVTGFSAASVAHNSAVKQFQSANAKSSKVPKASRDPKSSKVPKASSSPGPSGSKTPKASASPAPSSRR